VPVVLTQDLDNLHGQQVQDVLTKLGGDPFAAGGAYASGVGQPTPSDSLTNPIRNTGTLDMRQPAPPQATVVDAAAQTLAPGNLGSSVEDHIQALNQQLPNPFASLPDLGAGLQSDSYANSPVAQQANGQRPAPGLVVDQASDALAHTVAGGATAAGIPVVEGALAGALNPKNLPGGEIGAPFQLATDAAIPLVKDGAGRLADAGLSALDRSAPPDIAYASTHANDAERDTQARIDVMQGLLNLLRTSGEHDPAELDSLQTQIDAMKAQTGADTVRPGVVDQMGSGAQRLRQAAQDRNTPPVDSLSVDASLPADSAQTAPQADGAPQDMSAESEAPSSSTPEWLRIAQDSVQAQRDGTLPAGSQSAAKPAVDVPTKIISDADLPPSELPTPDTLPRRITPDMMQAAHEQINRSAGDQAAEHDQLDQLVQSNANPAEIARFMAQVRGDSVSFVDNLRTVRTGSMAGGDTTEGKVLLSPIIQTAMRAPVGALKAIVKGRPGDIPNGMAGGWSGLAEGAQDALQTIKYGISDRAALSGSAAGGYGFKPGIDVLGKNSLQRGLGTAAIGLVRTHGAISDLSAGIGRGAAAATGASPEAAAETGQQWAMRSGNYGTIGQVVATALQDVKNVNPALDVVGQILVPFYRVGYNAMTQGVERSPVGLVGTAADIARSKLPESAPEWLKGPYAAGADASHVTPVGDRLANNMFGVGLGAIGFGEASQGNITGDHPESGNPKWSVRVAGQWIPLRYLGPAGEALSQSADLYESARDGKGNIARTATLSASTYVAHVYDETWLRSVGDILTALGDARDIGTSRESAALKDIGYKAGSMVKSFLPQAALIGQGAKALNIGQSAPAPQVPASRSSRATPNRNARATR
jgi:hypothetical protein